MVDDIWDLTNRIRSKSTAEEKLEAIHAKESLNFSEQQGLLTVTEFVIYLWNVAHI